MGAASSDRRRYNVVCDALLITGTPVPPLDDELSTSLFRAGLLTAPQERGPPMWSRA